MSLKKKEDWVALFNTLKQSFPHLDTSELLQKETADYYYRAVALLQEASTVHSNFGATQLSELRINPASAFRLQYITPCLAVSAEDLKPEKKEELFTSGRWVFTHKRNGVRGWLIRVGGFTALYSRNYSQEDGRLLDYSEHLHPILSGVNLFSGDFVIDVEIEMASGANVQVLEELGLPTSPLELVSSGLLGCLSATCIERQRLYYERTGEPLVHLNLITPLVWKGNNYINRRLQDAYDVRSEVITALKPFIPVLFDIDMVSGSKEEKVEFLERLLATGAEGVVAHNLDGFYSTGVNRRKDVYVKLKRSVSQTNMKGETVDAWIVGAELGTKGTKNENRLSTLVVALTLIDTTNNTRTVHTIARVSGLTDAVVKEISDYSAPIPVLKAEMLDRVVEVDGQGVSSQSFRLTHPRFIRFRDDKSKEDCFLTTDFLEACQDKVAHHTRL